MSNQHIMRVFKFIFSLTVTFALIYLFDNRWVIGGNPIPPLGKFLDPFHGFWQNIERPASAAERIQIPGLKAEVKIVFDSLDIPHIFASNDEDLYYAQGYVTATHRLW
ncbi:MAG TPA: penicillin acylase family protein, partial [Chryseolinea sp.]